jgi:hypothetical protein
VASDYVPPAQPDGQYEPARREAADRPVTFGLCGERFATKVEVDGLVIMELAKAGTDQDSADDEDQGANMAALAALYEFMAAVLPSGEWRRFRKVVRRRNVGLELILHIARDIMPLLFGRPTTPSSASAASPSTNGHSSTDGVVSAAPAPSSS